MHSLNLQHSPGKTEVLQSLGVHLCLDDEFVTEVIVDAKICYEFLRNQEWDEYS